MLVEGEKKILKERLEKKNISCEPYTLEEIKQFTIFDCMRIERSIKNVRVQEEEGRYFFSSDIMRMNCSQKISAMRKFFAPIRTWLDAEKQNVLDEYFAGRGEWPGFGEKNGSLARTRIIEYSNDIDDYYKQRGIINWQQAKDAGKIEEYFSGIGIFPKVDRDYRKFAVALDYDEFIRAISYEEFLLHVRAVSDHISPKMENYTNARYFYQTAMTQFDDYKDIIASMPSPIYIPGDGIGIASRIAQMCEKEYYSTEPNEIGREARLQGVITSDKKFSLEDAYTCASVFIGNCHKYFLTEEILDAMKDLVVVVYDEIPPIFKQLVPYGNYKCWINQKEEESCEDVFFGQEALENLVVTIESIDAPAAVYVKYVAHANKRKYEYVVGKRGVNIRMKSVKKKDIYLDTLYVFVLPISIVPKYQNYYHITKRCYLNDDRHAKNGDIKRYGLNVIEWFQDRKYMLDGEWRSFNYARYDRAHVIEAFTRDGYELIVSVRNPHKKTHAVVGSYLVRVQLMRYDRESKIARYRILSDLAYAKQNESLLRTDWDG